MTPSEQVLAKEALDLCRLKWLHYSDDSISNFSDTDKLMYEVGRLASPKGWKERKLEEAKKHDINNMHVR